MKHFIRICLLIVVFFIAFHLTITLISDKHKGDRDNAVTSKTASTTEVPVYETEAVNETTESDEDTEVLITHATTEEYITTEASDTTETTEQKKTTEAATQAVNIQTQHSQKNNAGETYIFVGDSRYVQMESYAEDDDTFICENGVGYRFLSNHMDEIVSLADADTKIVIGLGVNDVLSGTKKYKELLFDLADRTDAQVYYMLINPVDDELCAENGYAITNEDIDNFNITIQSELIGSGIKIIDVNSYLKAVGFTSRDGLHYNASTSQNIYVYIKEQMISN